MDFQPTFTTDPVIIWYQRTETADIMQHYELCQICPFMR